LAHADGLGVRHLGAVERLDDAPLPQDALVAVDGCRRGRDADDAVQITAPELVDLVLRTPGDERVLERLTLAVEALVVHPRCELVEVDHRFPTSCSRYSAYFALAAASFFGRCSVGQRSSVGLYSRSNCRAMVTLCTSVGPSARPIDAAPWIMPLNGISLL